VFAQNLIAIANVSIIVYIITKGECMTSSECLWTTAYPQFVTSAVSCNCIFKIYLVHLNFVMMSYERSPLFSGSVCSTDSDCARLLHARECR